jgi:hypothetical protein
LPVAPTTATRMRSTCARAVPLRRGTTPVGSASRLFVGMHIAIMGLASLLAAQRKEQAMAQARNRRGFAGMDPEEQRRIASAGGRASHASGHGHEWSSREAQAAGRRGGLAARHHDRLGVHPVPPPVPPPSSREGDREQQAAEGGAAAPTWGRNEDVERGSDEAAARDSRAARGSSAGDSS